MAGLKYIFKCQSETILKASQYSRFENGLRRKKHLDAGILICQR